MARANDVEKYVRQLRGRGSRIDIRKRRKHLQIVAEDSGELITTIPATPGSNRWQANLDQRLKQAGLYPSEDPKKLRALQSAERRKQTQEEVSMAEKLAAMPQTDTHIPTLEDQLREAHARAQRLVGRGYQARFSRVMTNYFPASASPSSGSVTNALTRWLNGVNVLDHNTGLALTRTLYQVQRMTDDEFKDALMTTVREPRSEFGMWVLEQFTQAKLTTDRASARYVFRVAKERMSVTMEEEKFTNTVIDLMAGNTIRTHHEVEVRNMIEAALAKQEQPEPEPEPEPEPTRPPPSPPYEGPETVNETTTSWTGVPQPVNGRVSVDALAFIRVSLKGRSPAVDLVLEDVLEMAARL